MRLRRLLRRATPLGVGAMFGLLALPITAHAHTTLDYTLPTDGASVGTPVDEITIAFTSPVTLVGNGFAVLDPQNQELEPLAVSTDNIVFRLQLDPPLAGGTVGVKYEVRAEDGHVLTGNFVFEVAAPLPTTAPPTTVASTTTSSTTAPSTTVSADTSTTVAATSTTAAPETVEPGADTTPANHHCDR